MNDHNNTERELRDLAFQHLNELILDDAEPMEPARLSQMVSLRLDSDVVAALRDLANKRGTTVSELLREGAGLILERENTRSEVQFAYKVVVSQNRSVFDSSLAGRTGTERYGHAAAALVTASNRC